MSTILDALRKVERERDVAPEHPLEPQPLAPEARRRRNIPVSAIVVCAVVGFGGGALLSWWTPSEESSVETIASLPVPPPPPAIAVPRAPVPEPPAPAVAPVPVQPEPVAPPQAQLAQQAPPQAAPPLAAAPPAAPPAEPALQQPPAIVAVEKAPPQAARASAPAAATDGASNEMLAALGKDGTALEPSPFGPARNAAREAAAPPVAVPGPAKPPAVGNEKPERDVAALAPIEPAIPEPAPMDIAPEPEAEPEPETPPETVFDTGRSPPGAPKVALSFLQWSADPAKRFAFISIDGQPSQRIREGESAAGMTVAAITPTGVQFKREGSSFVIRPRH